MGFLESFGIGFVVLIVLSLLISSVGFYKYVYFISLGYGFSVAGMGVFMLIYYLGVLDIGTLVMSLLYALQVSPLLFRLEAAKKKNPNRFCDKGLYKIVRCPNYLGEVLFWTGVFVSGVNIYASAWQWIAAAFGYACIVYIMFTSGICPI